MAQEFTIKSQQIENKINQLLPSQGGYQAGIDFSASTMVIPIVDLTETAEGSSLRQDLQKALSLSSITSTQTGNTTNTLINTTGWFRVFGNVFVDGSFGRLELTDGTTTKIVQSYSADTGDYYCKDFDFIIKLEAGDSFQAFSNSNNCLFRTVTRQIADLAENLVSP